MRGKYTSRQYRIRDAERVQPSIHLTICPQLLAQVFVVSVGSLRYKAGRRSSRWWSRTNLQEQFVDFVAFLRFCGSCRCGMRIEILAATLSHPVVLASCKVVHPIHFVASWTYISLLSSADCGFARRNRRGEGKVPPHCSLLGPSYTPNALSYHRYPFGRHGFEVRSTRRRHMVPHMFSISYLHVAHQYPQHNLCHVYRTTFHNVSV